MKREYPDHPLVGVGAVVVKDRKVLLVQRNRHPGLGLWAIPGGMVELGEPMRRAAEREILEETGLLIRAGEPFYTVDVIVRDKADKILYHYAIIDFRADYLSGEVRAGDDVSGAGWFGWAELESLNLSPNTMKVLKKIEEEIR